MLTIIIAVILAVIVFVALGIDFEKEVWKPRRRQLFALIPLLLILTQFFTIIPANTVGIKWSVFGGVKQETLSEGIAFRSPLDKVYKISTETQTKTLTDISGQTRDSQYVTMQIDVKYKVDTTYAFTIFQQFRTLERVDSDLIAPTVQRAVETVTTQFNVIELLGEKRNEVYVGIEKELESRLNEYGITFVSINFDDTDAGASIEQAIQAEAIAKKAVETAQQELLRAETEAQQIVVQAQAEQEQARIQAETRIIEAQAEAEANEMISASISDTILQKMYYDKWNGDLPQVVSESSGILVTPGN